MAPGVAAPGPVERHGAAREKIPKDGRTMEDFLRIQLEYGMLMGHFYGMLGLFCLVYLMFECAAPKKNRI